MTTERPVVHVKLDYLDALESKKGILEIEKSLVELGEIIANFNSFRKKELKTKMKLCKSSKDFSNILKNLKKELPEPKIPKILKHQEKERTVARIKKVKQTSDIDFQLQDIQEKLRALSGKK